MSLQVRPFNYSRPAVVARQLSKLDAIEFKTNNAGGKQQDVSGDYFQKIKLFPVSYDDLLSSVPIYES